MLSLLISLLPLISGILLVVGSTLLAIGFLLGFLELVTSVSASPPFSYDEEIDWLMDEHGLSAFEAHEIAILGRR